MAARPQELAGKGSHERLGSHEEPPVSFGAGAEHRNLASRPRAPRAHWATRYRLYLQKLVDFPPQLNRLTASEIGFEFLVWTNQWTTRKTTKTTTKEIVLNVTWKTTVSKEKSLAKKVSGARQGKKFLLQYTDQCKTIKHPDSELLFIAYYSEQKDRLDESHF